MPKVNINDYIDKDEDEYSKIRTKRKKNILKEDININPKRKYDKNRTTGRNK